MRAINVVLAVVVSLVIGLAVFEAGLRLIGRGPEKTFLEFDEHVGWRKRPGARQSRSTREFDVHFEINELGLRDDPLSNPKKPANTFRVLMLGDSFTLGFSVERQDLFLELLEDWWQAENRRVDVINAGTQGFSTDQSVLWFREHGPAFEPDLAVLCCYENDLYWNGADDYNGKPKPLFSPAGELETGTLADTTKHTWMERWAITSLFRKRAGVTPEHLFTPEGGPRPILKEQGALLLDEPDFMRDAVARTRGALSAWKADCAAAGVRPVLLLIPSRSAVDTEHRQGFSRVLGLAPDRWSPDKPVDTFLALARELGLDALDARTYLKGAGGGKLYYDFDWHVNPAGNRALARFVHDELDHLGAFPEGHRPPPGAPVSMPDTVERGGVPFALKLYAALWAALTLLYLVNYKDEPRWKPPLEVAALLAAVFGIVIGGKWLVGLLPPKIAPLVLVTFVIGILTFVAYKLGQRLGTILELIRSFVMRGHWYLMPLVIVLLTIGSLLVVAASSPFVAPFIYTLF